METDSKHRRNGIKYELFQRIVLKLVKRLFELALTYFTRHLQPFPWMFQVPKSFTNQTIHRYVAPRSTFFWAMVVELKHVTIKHVTSFHGISYDENMNEYDIYIYIHIHTNINYINSTLFWFHPCHGLPWHPWSMNGGFSSHDISLYVSKSELGVSRDLHVWQKQSFILNTNYIYQLNSQQ